jgi:two-component system sensor histidine kinase MtrB
MRRVARLWRRSLQVRVVVSTVVLSTLVIVLTGWFVVRDVADGLTQNRRTAAIAQAESGFEYAQLQLNAAVETEPAVQSATLTQMVDSLTRSRGTARSYELVLQGPLSEDGEQVPVRSSTALDAAALPAQLQGTVRESPGLYWQHTSLVTSQGDDVRREPALAVGSRLSVPATGDTYAMFYIFSLAEQQQALSLVRNALLLGGVIMVVLVGAVAWLVSKQVLDPVRMARRIAERYASGQLEQRMHVTGEDDIARLSTSFNQMAASLHSQIRRLENLSRLQQRFVSDVSHELRTPLTTVRMASEVLHSGRDQFDPQAARATELLTGELDRFEALLSDLLDLSRFDAGAAQLELSDVDMAAVARDCRNNSSVKLADMSVRVLGAFEPAVVSADVRRVDRIVRNILANAAKYSLASVLEVRVAHNNECVSLAIRDYGVGIAEPDLSRIFDRFWRADPARTQGGTGLGLSIAREDAVLHGGTLEAWSLVGRGTEFVLTLPKSGGSVQRPALRSVFDV